MRRVNPYDQRFKDFHDSSLSTVVSMISQAGKRHDGNVALNDDPGNLNKLGLIELYETLQNRAMDFSINSSTPGGGDAGAANTILFAASRIADLYTLLGNEAYADALDPTIGFGTESGEYNIMAPSIFCFQNQLPSLLEEELALLRGISAKNTGEHPYEKPLYNRLMWNFTSSEGEVAYANSYNITDEDGDGDIDEFDAKLMYPQGHGDAWGHYLTAIKKYYDLITHNKFTWFARSESVLVTGVPVNVDYLDERKFASIAAAKARAGAEIVELTYRSNFVEDPNGQWQGYEDSDPSRAWGLSEWASRAGQGAYLDWVVGNAILPETNPNKGIKKVDRTTVMELREIAGCFNDIQSQQDKANIGLNPLGIAKDAVPFDINPYELVDAQGQPTGRTHFEQVSDRAVQALNNAVTTFNRANQSTQMLRKQMDAIEDFVDTVEDREADFENRLIEVFGYPYADDIGPTGTYPDGYRGPDLYHYMYVDTSELMGIEPVIEKVFTVKMKDLDVDADGGVTETLTDVKFHLAANGLGLIKPDAWTKKRRAPGEIQMARSDLLQAKARFERAMTDYDNLLLQIEDQAYLLKAQHDLNATEIQILDSVLNQQVSLNAAIAGSRSQQLSFRTVGRTATLIANSLAEFVPQTIGWAAADTMSAIRGAIRLGGAIINEVMSRKADAESLDGLGHQQAKENHAIEQQLRQLEQLIRSEASQRLDLYTIQESMQQASGRYLSALAKGQRLIEDRLRFRKQTAPNIQHYRYKDMAFRVFRNEALQQYRAQMDLAALYVYLAAKAYDYETSLLPVDSLAGQQYLTDVIRQRAIGQMDNGVPGPGQGLAGVMAKLNQNFNALKGQLGFNNPQVETNYFSLRKECFKIMELHSSDSRWRDKLKVFRVDNLWDSYPQFRRYCKPYDSEDVPEPAIVIPFKTTVSSRTNFFGKELGADSYYAAENFATKVRSVGIWFSNYNTSILSPTPRVYLIPIGLDVLRTPSGDIGDIRYWQIAEQRIPEPFPLVEQDLDDQQWIPIVETLPDAFAGIRRHGRLRAYPDGGFNTDEMTYDSRLVGRSVWNTKWLLIIPGASLMADPGEAIEQFIEGSPVPGTDGKGDGNGVTDIKLFFKTYSYAGY
jgi:hypothetical protein